jgi:hypothetical protein
MNRKSFHLSIILIFFLVLAASAPIYAQVDTGAVIGTVTGDDGLAIPDCEVTIIGKTIMGGKLATRTSELGKYRFPSVPVGIYTIEFKKEGFALLRRENIQLHIDSKIEVNAVLKTEKIQQQVLVVAEAPLIDVAKPNFNSNIDRSTLEVLPLDRGALINNLKNFNPGDTGTSIQGSPWYSSSYFIDGSDANDPGSGGAWVVPGFESVEEVQFIYGGASAEYGNFSGSIVKMITKSGSNKFSGWAGINYSNQSLESKNSDAAIATETRFDYTLDFSLSGPIIKDKIWFFADAYALARDRRSLSTERTVNYRNGQYTAKLTMSLIPNLRTSLSLFIINKKTNNLGAENQFRADETLQDLKHETQELAFVNNWIINNKLMLDTNFNYQRAKYSYPPRSNDVRVTYLATGMITGSQGMIQDTHQANLVLNGSLTYFLENFYGSHEWKMGSEYQWAFRGSDLGYIGGMNIIDMGNGIRQATISPPYYFSNNMERFSGFLQDNWTIKNRLTLGLGVRYDNIRGYFKDQEQPDGTVIPATGTALRLHHLSPRLALNYEITSDGKTMFRINWGKYYEAVRVWLYSSLNPSGPDLSLGIQMPGQTTWTILQSLPYSVTYWDPDIKDMSNDILTASLERQIFPNALLSLNYIKKWEGNRFGLLPYHSYIPVSVTDSFSGEAVTVYKYDTSSPVVGWYFTNFPEEMGLKFRYDAFEIVFNKRFSKKWMLNVSYHYEKCWGTSDDFGNSLFGGLANVGAMQITPNTMINWEGPFSYNRPHQFKCIAAYEAPWGIMASTYISYWSGLPYNRTHVIQDFVNGINATYDAEPRNSHRLPSVFNMNVLLQKTFRLKGTSVIQLSAYITNIFNSGTVTGYFTETGSPLQSFYGEVSNIVSPRQVRLGTKVSF